MAYGNGAHPAGDNPSVPDSLLANAERFITQFHDENRAGAPGSRLRQVRREIETTGTYQHTVAELEFVAPTSTRWLNWSSAHASRGGTVRGASGDCTGRA